MPAVQRRYRPGEQPDVVEPTVEGDLGEVAGLAGMAADHRIGADHDDESVGRLLEVHHCHLFHMWDVE
jgi:hypothetical protein